MSSEIADSPLTAATAPSTDIGPSSRQGAHDIALEILRDRRGGDTTAPPAPAEHYDPTLDPVYGHMQRVELARRYAAEGEAQVDRLIKEFTSRVDVDYFDEKGVLREWAELGAEPHQLEQAWRNWRQKTMTFTAARRDSIGPRGKLIETSAGKNQPKIGGAVASAAELRRREEQYRVKRELPADIKTERGALHYAVDQIKKLKASA